MKLRHLLFIIPILATLYCFTNIKTDHILLNKVFTVAEKQYKEMLKKSTDLTGIPELQHQTEKLNMYLLAIGQVVSGREVSGMFMSILKTSNGKKLLKNGRLPWKNNISPL